MLRVIEYCAVTQGHSSSFEVVLFESLDTVSYLHFIEPMAVYLAVCETFSVKEYRYLEIWVRGRSRSLKMALFDRP